MMGALPVPTHKEMDELYKDFHILKKRVRTLAKRMDQWEEKFSPEESGA